MMTNEFIPPGRLSSHNHNGRTLQIQTEYALRPQPRVTTSVALDGRIVHKTDRPWELPVDTDVGRSQLERFLVEQHRQVKEFVIARAAEFIEDTQTEQTNDSESPTFRESMVEVLSALPSMVAVYEFDRDGQPIYTHHLRDVYSDWTREFQVLTQMVAALPQLIRVGDFHSGCCHFQTENILLLRIRGRTFGLLTDPSGSIEELQREFPELVEAVYG